MPDKLQILKIRLSQLDINNDTINDIEVDTNAEDLQDYLQDLLEEIDPNQKKREFEFRSDTTEFRSCLTSLIKEEDFNASEPIVLRLLAVEKEAERKYGHLTANKNHVKRGSYLQFLYEDESGIKYLGVKVDHQGFIDEKDLKKHIGLAINDKVYKAVRVAIRNNKPEFIDVYDSQSKISHYWWSEFLELSQIRDDSYNTREACSETIKKLHSIRKISEHDYTTLRNATVSAFKQEGSMDYIKFVEDIFENYVPEIAEVKEKLDKITPHLKTLPQSKKFDAVFDLDASAVTYRKSTVKLHDEISITYEEGMVDLDDKIWSETTADGDKLVVIKSDRGFGKFKEKRREP